MHYSMHQKVLFRTLNTDFSALNSVFIVPYETNPWYKYDLLDDRFFYYLILGEKKIGF